MGAKVETEPVYAAYWRGTKLCSAPHCDRSESGVQTNTTCVQHQLPEDELAGVTKAGSLIFIYIAHGDPDGAPTLITSK